MRRSVHPEAYPVCRTIAAKSGRPLKSLIGDKAFLSMLQPESFAGRTVRRADGHRHHRRTA